MEEQNLVARLVKMLANKDNDEMFKVIVGREEYLGEN
jgi:hypothetical protein